MMEEEGGEQEITLQQEPILYNGGGGGAVNSVNGQTGDVVLTTSDLQNTSDYQTGSQVTATVNAAVGAEETARQNADNSLQGQIDALSASSDVTDIVGTYAELQAYDTSKLKDNDIIKVLQDESHSDETTYYRWSTDTETFTLIGEEGPYYTKSQTDTLLNAKQNNLTAGSNITITNDTISATDTTYSAGTGLDLTGTTFSADTTVLATQTDLASKQNTLTAGSNITITNDTISATDTTYSAFVGTDGNTDGSAGLVPAPQTTDAGKFLKADGTWDTAGGGGGPTVVQTTGTSQTDVMSQNATTTMIFRDPNSLQQVQIGSSANASGPSSVAIGYKSSVSPAGSVAIGANANTNSQYSISLGYQAKATRKGELNIGSGVYSAYGYNNTPYRVIGGVHDGQLANDAVTVSQVNATIDAINTALSTNIPHIGA